MAGFPALTTTTMITRVRRLLNEPTPLNYTDGQITDWIEQAARTISERTLCVEEANTTCTLLNNTFLDPYADLGISDCIKIETIIYLGEAAVPPDYNGLLGAADPGPHALIKVHLRQFNHLNHLFAGTTADIPRYWCDVGGTVYWTPHHNTTYDGNMFYILYYKEADIYETGGTYSLPEYMREYVLIYAYAKALAAENRVAQSAQYMSMFDNLMTFHRQDRYIKPVDSKDMMVLADNTQFVQ